MAKEDVEVNVTSGNLIIKAQKETSSDKSDTNYLRRERHRATWSREISFPEEVDSEKAHGSMKDGVLELTIPKKEPKIKDQVHKVQIN